MSAAVLTLVNRGTGEVIFSGERVRRGLPCPICAHLHSTPSWCLIDTARRKVICPRVQSVKKCGDAGWWHDLDGASVEVSVRVLPVAEPKPCIDFADRWKRAQERRQASDVQRLSERLGLAEEWLRAIPFGVDGEAWAFPMTGEDGRIVGLKLRTFDGKKICAKGSRLGLILPRAFKKDAPELWVTEGESDLMAAVGAFGVNAVARPGCTSCTRQIAQMAEGKHLIVLADNDKAGREGAAALLAACEGARSATVLLPPAKDVREWVKGGATAADVRWRLKSRRGW
jgi:hypothetical protein